MRRAAAETLRQTAPSRDAAAPDKATAVDTLRVKKECKVPYDVSLCLHSPGPEGLNEARVRRETALETVCFSRAYLCTVQSAGAEFCKSQ